MVTLDLTGSGSATPANATQVLNPDNSCWNLSQEVSQRIARAPRTPEDARTIEQQDADDALAAEAAELLQYA